MPSEEITWGEKDRTRPTLNLFQGQEWRFPLERSRWDCQIGAPIKTRREKERAKNVIRDSLRMKRPFLRPLFLILSPFLRRTRKRTQGSGDVHYFSTRGVICTCRGKVSSPHIGLTGRITAVLHAIKSAAALDKNAREMDGGGVSFLSLPFPLCSVFSSSTHLRILRNQTRASQ